MIMGTEEEKVRQGSWRCLVTGDENAVTAVQKTWWGLLTPSVMGVWGISPSYILVQAIWAMK